MLPNLTIEKSPGRSKCLKCSVRRCKARQQMGDHLSVEYRVVDCDRYRHWLTSYIETVILCGLLWVVMLVVERLF